MGSIVYAQIQAQEALWGAELSLASLAITMTVNALATGLIVVRTFMVFQSRVISDDQGYGATRRTKYHICND